MKKFQRLFLIATFLVASIYFLGVNTPTAEAKTVEELQAQIEELLARVAELQEQIIEIQGGETEWCYDFNVNLRIEMRGAKVRALQTALQKEGYEIPASETDLPGYFGVYTASAVVQFQEKYASEILASWKLTTGTGYVGSTTRAKLNELYGCKEKKPKKLYIRVTSPNGGETWKTGETRTITWSTAGYDSTASIQIGLRDTRYSSALAPGEATIANTVNTGSYAWTIPSDPSDLAGFETFGAGNVYKVVIYIAGGGPGKFDLSNDNFSIVAASAEESITVISPNGGEEWERGSIQKITWSYEPLPPDKFKINLVNVNTDTVVTNLKSCGIADVHQDSDQPTKFWWNWKVGENVEGTTIPALGPYRIMVDDCEETKDFSDASFTMVNPLEKSITVISPNGGETWKTGETRAITWSTAGYDSTVSIQIGLRDIRYSPTLAPGEATIVNTTNTGSYTWTIPSDPSDLAGFETFGAGNVYKVVIYIAGGGPGKFDLSNNNFSIVEGGIGLENIEDQLAAVSNRISNLIERIKKLIRR